jgi:hypothetical protein
MGREHLTSPRGQCTGCRREHALDDDGMIRRHRRPGSTESGPLAASRDLCLGSYERPAGPSGVDPWGLASSA